MTYAIAFKDETRPSQWAHRTARPLIVVMLEVALINSIFARRDYDNPVRVVPA